MTAYEIEVANRARRGGDALGAAINVGDRERAASLFGGALLAAYGLSRGTQLGIGLALAGGLLAYRGLTGRSAAYNAIGVSTAGAQSGVVHVEHTVTVARPAAELYDFWRNFENLPRFMKHLESVTREDGRSHWVARGPAGTKVAWDAEIVEERDHELIAWRSLPGAQVASAGRVEFREAPGDRGTEIRVSFDYTPPAGALGAWFAGLFGEEPNVQVVNDLRRFKQVMETGEIATVAGQPHGQRSPIGALLGKPRPEPTQRSEPRKPPVRKSDVVMEASADSFPASDPPAWSGSGIASR